MQVLKIKKIKKILKKRNAVFFQGKSGNIFLFPMTPISPLKTEYIEKRKKILSEIKKGSSS